MGVGVRTKDLCKTYRTLSPLGPRSGIFRRGATAKNRKPDIAALDQISLDIPPGQIFGLLGPNGAGKSTAVGILTARVRPTSGEAWIGDYEIWHEQVKAKRLIGVVQQRPNLDFALTAREILSFHAAYFGIHVEKRKRNAQELLERFQLADRADETVRTFSAGMMQRLSIARAMMHDPEVLFLDEPSTGLDTQTRLLLWEIIRDYQGQGKTILITTHNMDEADALCHRVAIIDHGKVIAMGTPKELKDSIPGGYLVRLRFTSEAHALAEHLRQLPGVSEIRVRDEKVDVYADRGGSLVPGIVAVASTAGFDLCDIHISEPSLENLFLHHTGRSLRQ